MFLWDKCITSLKKNFMLIIFEKMFSIHKYHLSQRSLFMSDKRVRSYVCVCKY